MRILETERLVLRRLTLDDTADLYEILSDPQVMRYYPAPFTRQQTIGWIEWNVHSYVQYGFGLWAVVRKDDGLVLGDCGLTMQPVEGQPYHRDRLSPQASRMGPRLCDGGYAGLP